ncbi:MAG: hypothetical protein ACRDGM_15310 [bacterium]
MTYMIAAGPLTLLHENRTVTRRFSEQTLSSVAVARAVDPVVGDAAFGVQGEAHALAAGPRAVDPRVGR